jgi:hypothetical protein
LDFNWISIALKNNNLCVSVNPNVVATNLTYAIRKPSDLY